MSEITVITPPVAESAIDHDLVNLTEFIWKTHHADEPYGYGLGGEFGYGPYDGFENDVFEMRSFYWGDCDCGYGAVADAASALIGDHTAECFGTRFNAAQDRLRAQGKDLYGEDRGLMVAWAKANGFPGAPFGMAVHCDCGIAERYESWYATNPHPETCTTLLPNFRHKASGLEIRWYKWIGRDMEYAPSKPRASKWRAIFDECVASVP